MKFLESFSDRNPIYDQVKMWEDYLTKTYINFSDTEFGKMIAVGDKSYFLKDKSQLTNKIFIEVKYSVKGKIHEGSLRKAIKNWIDKNNIYNMNYLKKFNEEVGFDDEETKDRLEIPNLRGELEPNSPDMKTYFLPTDKVNTKTELKKIIFRYPILEEFHRDEKRIEGSILSSFYATSKNPVDGNDFYAQLSFAFHNDQYYIGTILRDRFEDNEEQWTRHTFFFDKVEDAFPVAYSFLKCCGKLGVLDSDDLTEYDFLFN